MVGADPSICMLSSRHWSSLLGHLIYIARSSCKDNGGVNRELSVGTIVFYPK